MAHLPDKICPRCKQLVEVHFEGWFQDHNTKKGNVCGLSGATAYSGKKLDELQEEAES